MKYFDIDNNFFGRQETLELLKRRVVDLKDGYRQNVALLGNPFVGKSSVLKKFFQDLDDRDLIVVYLDLDRKNFHYFFSKFLISLLYGYAKSQGLPAHDKLDLLIETVKPTIPQTIEVVTRIQSEFNKEKYVAAYLGLLALPEVFTNETGKFCVLIFDEFQELGEFDIAGEFQELGKKIMTQKKCLYVLSSSYPALAVRIIAEKLSLLFGNFETLFIEPFDMAMSQEFVQRNLPDLRMGATLRNFLADFAGGHPLYLTLICREIVHLSALHHQSEVYMPIMSQAVENTLFDRWGVISRHFELMMNELCPPKSGRMLAGVLVSLANGNHRLSQIVDDVRISRNQLTQKMNRLIELGIIVKNGTFHCFKDKLFKYWIKFIYQRRLKHVDLLMDDCRREYKDEFNACIEAFNAQSRKDFATRIVELMHCFDNESFDLNGRKYKLPTFREITSHKVRGENGNSLDFIKASTGESEWFVVLKKDSIAETDVNTILQESRKNDAKPEHCVLISLTELDEHTRLKALQEKFWIWNEGELNALLALYDKPFIPK